MFAFAGLSGRLSLESGLRAVHECKIEFACVVVEPSILQGRPLRCLARLFRDGPLPAAKSFPPPVLFSGIEPSTHRAIYSSSHGPINTWTHPPQLNSSRGPPVTSVLSTLPVVVTILLLLIPRPRDAISSTTPTLLRDWHSEMCRASTVRGQWECWSQESNIGYTSIYLGASSLC